MIELNLAADEGIVLESSDVVWISRDEQTIDDFVLTNKKLYCSYKKGNGLFKKSTPLFCEFSLLDIKIINGQAQVQQIKRDGVICLQIQFVQRREIFSFSNTPKKTTPEWVFAINNALGLTVSTPDRNTNKKNNPFIKVFSGKSHNENSTESPQATFCMNCGAKIADTAKFCPNCGASTAKKAEDRDKETVGDVFASLTPEQKRIANILIQQAIVDAENGQEAGSQSNLSEKERNDISATLNTFSEKQKTVLYSIIGNEINRHKKQRNDSFQSKQETNNGTTSAQYEDASDKRQQEYAGKIIKCPACGEELPSYTAICPACGHEINGAQVSASLDSFIKQIENCDMQIANSSVVPKKGWATWGKWKKAGWVILNIYFACIPLLIYFLRPLLRTDKAPALTPEEKRKVAIVENFSFPNDRASILDGLLFIKSKVSLISSEKSSANNAYWMRLWTKKADDLFAKAELMFPGDTIARSAIEDIHGNYLSTRKKQKIRVGFAVSLVVVSLLFIIIRSGALDNMKTQNSVLVVPDTTLSNIMPQIDGGKGEVVTNNSTYFSVEYYGISDQDFENYKALCKKQGFTIDCENTGSLFDAYNELGYNIRTTYYSSKMHITITDAKKMRTITLPDSEIAKLLPLPKSNYGSIDSASDTCIIMYLGNTTIDDFNDYVDACIEKGFSTDMVRQDDHFHADNKDGAHVLIEYRGFNTIFVRIDNK